MQGRSGQTEAQGPTCGPMSYLIRPTEPSQKFQTSFNKTDQPITALCVLEQGEGTQRPPFPTTAEANDLKQTPALVFGSADGTYVSPSASCSLSNSAEAPATLRSSCWICHWNRLMGAGGATSQHAAVATRVVQSGNSSRLLLLLAVFSSRK